MDTKTLKFESLINAWTIRNSNLALVTQDGLCLVSRTQHAADLCSLPTAIQVTHKYLKLRAGELAICNDPYTGGSLTSQITLVTAFPVDGSDAHLLLLGVRIPTRPRLSFAKSVDEGGLKIPPTPIGNIDQPAQSVLDAIASHPLAPDDFLDRLEKGLTKLRETKKSFLASVGAFEIELTRSLYQADIQLVHQATRGLLAEFPHGHSEVQWQFENGEKLRLKLENNGEKLTLDFSGTGRFENFHLTEAQVLGCAVRTLEMVSGHSVRVNSGSLLALNILTPQNSLVSSQGSACTTLGVLVGSDIICDLIARAMCILHPKNKLMISYSAPLVLSFQFKSRSFFDLLPAGSLASPEKRGEASIETWNESSLSPSVEDVESKFPIEITSIKKRTESGGPGDQRGGDGVLKTYKLLEPARLRWFAGYPIKPEHNSGLGHPPEIITRIGDEESKHEELKGEIELPAGAEITALSRGGQGFTKD